MPRLVFCEVKQRPIDDPVEDAKKFGMEPVIKPYFAPITIDNLNITSEEWLKEQEMDKNIQPILSKLKSNRTYVTGEERLRRLRESIAAQRTFKDKWRWQLIKLGRILTSVKNFFK